MKKELTPKQDRIYRFVHTYVHKNHVSPSLREIGAHFDIAPGTVKDQLDALTRKGFLKQQEFRARGIQLGMSAFQIPIVGRVFAGTLHTAFEEIEGTIPGDSKKNGQDIFGLKIKGDSMNGTGIYDGDVVLVRKQSTAESGDIVVALVEDETTVKYFRQKGGSFYLEAANPKYQPIRNRDIKIIGKVIEVRRRYE